MERDTSKDEPVYSITSARSGHSDDLGSREKRYAISMGIRTLCFILAVVTWSVFDGGWVPWIFIAGAVILPYTSVILANAGVRRQGEGGNLMSPEAFGTLEAGPSDTSDQ